MKIKRIFEKVVANYNGTDICFVKVELKHDVRQMDSVVNRVVPRFAALRNG